MKISKTQLKKIVQEEYKKVVSEQYDASDEIFVDAIQKIDNLTLELSEKYSGEDLMEAAEIAKSKGEMAAHGVLSRAAKMSQAQGM